MIFFKNKLFKESIAGKELNEKTIRYPARIDKKTDFKNLEKHFSFPGNHCLFCLPTHQKPSKASTHANRNI